MNVPIGVVNLMNQVCCTPRIKSVNGISSSLHPSYMPIESSVGPIANLKGPYLQPSLSVFLSVCVSLTGTSTLQRRPILMKLGHMDPTVI